MKNVKRTYAINMLLLKDCRSGKVRLVDSLTESLLTDGIQRDFTTVTGGFSWDAGKILMSVSFGICYTNTVASRGMRCQESQILNTD